MDGWIKLDGAVESIFGDHKILPLMDRCIRCGATDVAILAAEVSPVCPVQEEEGKNDG